MFKINRNGAGKPDIAAVQNLNKPRQSNFSQGPVPQQFPQQGNSSVAMPSSTYATNPSVTPSIYVQQPNTSQSQYFNNMGSSMMRI